ncbi:hypothetical protein BDZ94DRAFT_1274119 [Collybia nuda]|uniref:ditrans,polycis-polyprenyl diphosphate synthase [(2E,6E)-farnesyldiphosphate specific] n=1 Tax=Collybia nuda TaxID=64659 RepID=A0A9P6C986_9AGAR|nr:hypothetical protein BDZ94DRAFT_1274119 [Collybia nuda]
MASVANVSLRVVHFIYALVIFIYSCWKRLTWSHPLPLTATRRRIPKHLALLLVTGSGDEHEDTEHTIVRSVINAVAWCRFSGIQKLTVYEEHGTLMKCAQTIREYFSTYSFEEESSEPEMQYPLTPPPSDHSGSRPISPEHGLYHDLNTNIIQISGSQLISKTDVQIENSKQPFECAHHTTEPLTLCIASRTSAKPAIAAVARFITSAHNKKHRKGIRSLREHVFVLGVDDLDLCLESEDNISSPDFMILHPINPPHFDRAPLELHGFPPWHIRLSEIYHNRFHSLPPILKWVIPSSSLTPFDELGFRRALDEFAMAEMRFGK